MRLARRGTMWLLSFGVLSPICLTVFSRSCFTSAAYTQRYVPSSRMIEIAYRSPLSEAFAYVSEYSTAQRERASHRVHIHAQTAFATRVATPTNAIPPCLHLSKKACTDERPFLHILCRLRRLCWPPTGGLLPSRFPCVCRVCCAGFSIAHCCPPPSTSPVGA